MLLGIPAYPGRYTATRDALRISIAPSPRRKDTLLYSDVGECHKTSHALASMARASSPIMCSLKVLSNVALLMVLSELSSELVSELECSELESSELESSELFSELVGRRGFGSWGFFVGAAAAGTSSSAAAFGRRRLLRPTFIQVMFHYLAPKLPYLSGYHGDSWPPRVHGNDRVTPH